MKKILHSNFFATIKSRIISHKILSTIAVILILLGTYWAYGALTSTSNETRYVVSAVQKGTIVVSVDGTGQVSASNQLDVKPQASGIIISVPAVGGQTMKEGQLIAEIDPRDAQKAVRDAEANLEAAQLQLQKLQEPADKLSLNQAENAIVDAQQQKQSAQDSLKKSYDDGFNTVANTFIDLPNIVNGLNSILNGTGVVSNGQTNAYAYYDMIKLYRQNADQFRDAALNSYQAAKMAYDKNLNDYKDTSRYSDLSDVEALINETYNTVKSISEANKNTKSFIDFVSDTLTNYAYLKNLPSILTTHENNVQNYTTITNNHLSDLLNITNTISNYRDSITASDRMIQEKTDALNQLKSGADPLDITSQELAVKQKQNALLDAKENLSNYYIVAPFNGVAASIGVKNGDLVSSGTTVATFITKEQIAEISLNEVDAAKIKVGQKVTLTFDAVPDVTIAGNVASIDTVGTVTQGVVTYTIKISFDTQDARIKPGMSVNASIITDIKQDVLTVPNSAIISRGNNNYVNIFDNSVVVSTSSQGFASAISPKEQQVVVGLSNDTDTEIISGLKEGDNVVVRTLTSSQSTTAAPSLFGSGLRLGGGGGARTSVPSSQR